MYSKNAWEKYSSEELKAVLDFSEGYKNFITVGKTERLCVSESERLAKENGFVSIDEVKELKPGSKVYFINKNKNMKIIDVSYGLNLEYSNYDEELWLSPNNFLMLATTVKNNLSEFISSKYIKEEINKNYEKIQEQVSIIDANLRNIASTSKASDNNVIITSTNALKFLENYGFKVISIEDDDNYTTELKNNFKNGKYKTLFIKKGESNDKINELKDTYKAKSVEVNMMDVLDDNERKNNEDYLSIMNSFLQNISDTCLNESK